jgi:hypothetical protein
MRSLSRGEHHPVRVNPPVSECALGLSKGAFAAL